MGNQHNHSVRVGVALSAGSAPALAQIGALEVLEQAGIPLGCTAGTSAGAIVGAAFAAGRLAELRKSLSALSRGQVVRLFDPAWSRDGLLRGRRGLELVQPYLGEQIEELTRPYAAVASDLRTGDEVMLASGSVYDAVRASIAIPGIFTPWHVAGQLLVDGGLVNPVPVSVSRALGADFVIAINVLPLRYAKLPDQLVAEQARRAISEVETDENGQPSGDEELGLIEVVSRATNILTSQVATLRLREDPPDYLLQIPIYDVNMFDLHRTTELVDAGRRCAEAALPELQAALLRALPLAARIRSWPRRIRQRLAGS